MMGDDETNTAQPAAEPAAAPAPVAPAADSAGNENVAGTALTHEISTADAPAGEPHRRRRRRRRRRGPKPEGGAPATGDAPASAVGPVTAEAGEASPANPNTLHLAQSQPRRMRVEAIAAGGEFTLAAAPAGERRRRRRRRPKSARPEGAATANGEAVAAEAGQQQRPPRERGPRRRGRRDDGREGFPRSEGAPRDEQGRERQAREGQPRGSQPHDGQRRQGQGLDGQRREGGERRDRGPRHGKGGKSFGGKGGPRDRDGRRDNKPAPKLYSFESVVDRGFEEIAAAPAGENGGEGESQTRRIDWSIVKRTVADQRAAKQVSALYVLKRDGAETEFPNLGAARAAVNKTIVHPEKLTRPKTDYPNKK
jgi:hypothetical protein